MASWKHHKGVNYWLLGSIAKVLITGFLEALQRGLFLASWKHRRGVNYWLLESIAEG